MLLAACAHVGCASVARNAQVVRPGMAISDEAAGAAVAESGATIGRRRVDLSGYTETGDYAEVVAVCHGLAARYPQAARCASIGTTMQGRALVALVVEVRAQGAGAASATSTQPTILVQAGIHAGEIEGKDASLAFASELLRFGTLDGQAAAGALDPNARSIAAAAHAARWIFVPVLSPDGHERRSVNNRPNQRGPREMGFRTNGVNLNLNRDYMKADSPEIRALLRVINEANPVMLVDLHTTDGAKFEHDVAVMVTPNAPRQDALAAPARALQTALQQRLTALGHLPLWFYPAWEKNDDPTSGAALGEPPARFSHGYSVQRGMLGVLVETHSWRSYRERYLSTYHVLRALGEQVVQQGRAWVEAQGAVAAANAKLAAQPVDLVYTPTGIEQVVAFRGYRITRVASEISGATWTQYDERTPEIWQVPLHGKLAPSVTVTAPVAGYVIDGGYAALVAPVLQAHGIVYQRIAIGPTAVAVETFRPTNVDLAARAYEGRQRAELKGDWRPESRVLAMGAIYVPIAQVRSRVVLGLLEPRSPDSMAGWGFFNAVFEQKEYLEDYVAEEEARNMLRADPALAAAWQVALADKAFAANPQARLAFFAKRHSSWDERHNLLPVFRIATVPALLR